MKMLTEEKILPACLAALIALAAAFPLSLPLAAQSGGSGVSRSMEQAIRLYHEGEDTEAMDRFMDILVKGSPSEKALANDYISKITLRMHTGVNTMKETETEVGSMNTVNNARPGTEARKAAASSQAGDDEPDESEDSAAAQKDRIAEKITAKIAQMRRDLLLQMRDSDAVKIYMGDSMPRAITLDPSFFFAGDTGFRTGTDKELSLISGLIFTLGKVNCLILPEGAAGGDVKIKSIRRALALNSYLEARGISKARLDVNLTGTDVQFPKELTNISGLIILFEYDKEPRLKELADIQTKGPKISLGVYPTAIAVQNNEGAVVEFSVMDSPVGIPSWTFQIFQIQKDGSRLQLQEINGSGAQYNQSFWNGRSKFFGAPYPSGKYIFTVTAKDVEGRESSLSRFVLVKPSAEEEKMMASKPAVQSAREKENEDETMTPSGVKSRSVKAGAAGGKTGKMLKAGSALRKGKKAPAAPKKKIKSKTKAKAKPDEAEGVDTEAEAPAGDATAADAPAGDTQAEAKPKKKAAAAEGGGGAPGEFSGQVSYKVYFKENTATITANSEKKLAQVAETLGYYPMASIALTGYAYSGEANAEVMAENRVNYVATRLAEKYKIARTRMNVKSQVSETPKSIVEIQMTGSE